MKITESIRDQARADPTSFYGPLQSFRKTFEKLHTTTALTSALASFGKQRAVPSLTCKPQKGYQSSSTIGTQPSASAWRKLCLGGRRAQTGGRPTKASRREHPYYKLNRKKSAPHNLTHCVEQNMALGGTH